MLKQLVQIQNKMWRVQHIISGNKIRLIPTWNWNGATGSLVELTGYTITPTTIHAQVANLLATNRLNSLLANNVTITLANPTRTYLDGVELVLVCDVLLNGVSVSKYFPDFQK